MDNAKTYTVYIDESGDLGVRKGTKWFVITAVIIDKQSENKMRSAVSNIKSVLNLKTIHFKDIREFNKKLYIVSQIKDIPFVIINVLVDTDQLDLYDSAKTYNFMSKILLERVSWFLKDLGLSAHVVFSSRNTRRDNELTNYLNDKVLSYSWNNVVSNTILSVKSEKMEKLDMLQIADVCAAAMFKSHETDRFGFTYPCFMNGLKKHLYTRYSHVFSYGIKYYKDTMRPDTNDFAKTAPCDYWISKNEKPPERT